MYLAEDWLVGGACSSGEEVRAGRSRGMVFMGA